MKSILLASAGALVCASMSLHAFEPATGLWWNPTESGRGFTVDYQNSFLAVTGFVYDQSGNPMWVQAVGPFKSTDTTITTQLYTASGGQCLGCAYKSPSSSVLGNVTITFTSNETANITFPGGSDQIQHELYTLPNQQSYLFGEWAFEFGNTTLVNSHWIVFNTTFDSSGTHYVAGFIDGQQSNTQALGQFVSGSGFIVVIQDATGYKFAFELPLYDDRHMKGLGDIYSPGEAFTDPTNAAVANRLLSAADLNISATQDKITAKTASEHVEDLKIFLEDYKSKHNLR